MPGNIPPELSEIRTQEQLMAFCDEALGGHQWAHTAILPAADNECIRFGWHWETWEIRSDDPYFAVGLHGPLLGSLEQTDEPLLPYSEVPLVYLMRGDDCFFALSLAKSDWFKRMIGDLRSEQYPTLAGAHWDSQSLVDLLHAVEQDTRCSGIVIREYSYRCPIDPSYTRGPWESHRSWTRRNLSDAVRELSEKSAWIRRLAFATQCTTDDGGEVPITGALTRSGVVSSNGPLSALWDLLMIPAAARAVELRAMFASRARGRCFEEVSRPIQITYGRDLFTEPDVNRIFITQLHELPDAAVSVYHGNPYVQAGVVDHLDGSSFTVWVVDADRIIISPGARASIASLDRLVAHIMDEFREGEVQEA